MTFLKTYKIVGEILYENKNGIFVLALSSTKMFFQNLRM